MKGVGGLEFQDFMGLYGFTVYRFRGGFICREAFVLVFYKESWFWQISAIWVLDVCGVLPESGSMLVCHDANHTMVPCRYDIDQFFEQSFYKIIRWCR